MKMPPFAFQSSSQNPIRLICFPGRKQEAIATVYKTAMALGVTLVLSSGAIPSAHAQVMTSGQVEPAPIYTVSIYSNDPGMIEAVRQDVYDYVELPKVYADRITLMPSSNSETSVIFVDNDLLKVSAPFGSMAYTMQLSLAMQKLRASAQPVTFAIEGVSPTAGLDDSGSPKKITFSKAIPAAAAQVGGAPAKSTDMPSLPAAPPPMERVLAPAPAEAPIQPAGARPAA